MRKQAEKIESILIYVGADLLGDGLLKLPFLRGLRQRYPDAKITWLAGQGATVFSGLLSSLVENEIDEVIADANIGVSWKELLKPAPLRGRHFDLVIDTQKCFVTALIVKRISHKKIISPALNFLFSDVKPDGKLPKNLQEQFLVFLRLATGLKHQKKKFTLELDDKFTRNADQLLESGKTYIGLAPGAGGRHKRWPLEQFISLAQQLTIEGKTPVFLLGPDEQDMAAQITKEVPGAQLPLQDRRSNYGFDPALTLALAKRMSLNVVNDAGVGHICALSSQPQITLFGPTSPGKFQPIVGDVHAMKAQDFGGSDMKLIPAEAVSEKITQLLAR